MKLWIGGAIFVAILMGITWMMAGGDIGANDTMGSLAMLGALATAVIAIFVSIKYVRQIQEEKAGGELADENWDGIGEYKNELPMGWAVLFLATTVWAVWYYLVGYPLNAYSQIGEYNEEVAIHDASFADKHANLDAQTLVKMGESVFIVQCSQCHGLAADGIDGKAANLNKRIEEKSVRHAIVNGANNLGYAAPMPDRNGLFNMNTGALITDAEIATVSKYVANGMKGAGEDVFQGTCAACHGSDGKGMEFVAPSIADFNPELVATVLKHGKKGVIGAMPAFDLLNEQQIKAVGAYVTSLSK
ncbi:MAG: c-type cytochrome [Campylobacterales bacterium]|nr:c-type cytochrome [Campylobacterales bacterium]